MRKLAICVVVLAVFCLAGCGNVYLRGEALMAAETFTMDALQAARRAGAEPLTPLPSEELALPPDEPDQGE